jgi:hypothetical protein
LWKKKKGKREEEKTRNKKKDLMERLLKRVVGERDEEKGSWRLCPTERREFGYSNLGGRKMIAQMDSAPNQNLFESDAEASLSS